MSFTYKGLEAIYDRHLVTEEEIDRHLERLQQQAPKITTVTDRPAQLGDELVLDYAGFCNGDQFAGGTAEKQTLTLGSGMFIPGFEEQLVGCNPGDEVTVHVTFPTPYHSDELAGKDAEFRCKIHEIREKSTFDMGDEFAQSMGLSTYAELRTQIGESLQQYSDARGILDLEDQLIRLAADNYDYQPDEAAVEEAVKEQMDAMAAQLAQQGLSIEMYAQFTGQTEEQLREDVRPQAITNLRIRAAAARIAELENLEATQEDITGALNEICHQNGLTMEQLQEYYDEALHDAIVKNVKLRKAMTFVRENANLTETNN